jgi:hypothetical protein
MFSSTHHHGGAHRTHQTSRHQEPKLHEGRALPSEVGHIAALAHDDALHVAVLLVLAHLLAEVAVLTHTVST